MGLMELRARWHMARKESVQAKELLRAAIGESPENTAIWETLSHALLQEGIDWTGAEMALKRVLELQPDNEEARRNLAVLRHQMETTMARA